MRQLYVEKYFSARALDYQLRSVGFPWLAMRRREMRTVLDVLGNVRDMDILELGSGSGFYTRELLARGARHIWAVDVSEPMLAALPSGAVTPVLGDAATIRLDRTFAVLLSAGMLEFVAEPEAVLANAAAHAESGARCVLLSPKPNIFGYIYREFHRSHGLRIRLFKRTWFDDVAAATGWSVVVSRSTSLFSVVTCLQRD